MNYWTANETLESVHMPNPEEMHFINSFGSVDKPMTLAEFIPFWNSLTVYEQYAARLDYYEVYGC